PRLARQKPEAAARGEDQEAAIRAYLDAVPADRRAQTKAYARGNYVLDVAAAAFDAAVAVAMLGWGISARMRDRARRLTRFRALQHAAYWVQFLVVTTLVAFPLTFYRAYHRE